VTDVRVGDRVYGLVGGGAYAEGVVVHARALAQAPASLPWEELAAIPEAFVTAYDAMVLQAGLAAGETVLVHAVGSGVGTAAVQIARAIGARAVGTARSPDKLQRCTPLGLAAGVTVGKEARFADAVRAANDGRDVDVVLDLVGGAYVSESLACLALRGRLALVGLLAGPRAEIDLARVLQRRHRIFGTVLRARPLEEKILAARALATHVTPLVASGACRAVIDRVLPLEQVADAHAHVASNAGFGKVVLTV
jgi:NADPH:quinone reductase-like Zn-dependent oxidoreductase